MNLTRTKLLYPHIFEMIISLKFDIQRSNYVTSIIMGNRPDSNNIEISEMRTGEGLDLGVASELLKYVNNLNKDTEYELQTSKNNS